MTLDLDELTEGWSCPSGELRARLITGRDGCEFVQIRLDLGVMQLAPTGRPDGAEFRGFRTACECVDQAARDRQRVDREAWQELERELQQFNYRRVAYGHLAEDALRASDDAATRRYIAAALDDVTACERRVRLQREVLGETPETSTLSATLAFDRGRLQTQLHLVDGQFERAVEQAEASAAELERLLAELGHDSDAIADDPGVAYLRELSVKLRREYGITQTLREQLAEAIEREDFESAAQLRDALRRRSGTPERPTDWDWPDM